MVADSSSTALACSVAPCAKDCAPVDTCSAPADTCSIEDFTSEIICRICSVNCARDLEMPWNAPGNSTSLVTLKSRFTMEEVIRVISWHADSSTCWLERSASAISPISSFDSYVTLSLKLPLLISINAARVSSRGLVIERISLTAKTSISVKNTTSKMPIRTNIRVAACCCSVTTCEICAVIASDRSPAASRSAFRAGVHSFTRMVLACSKLFCCSALVILGITSSQAATSEI